MSVLFKVENCFPCNINKFTATFVNLEAIIMKVGFVNIYPFQ